MHQILDGFPASEGLAWGRVQVLDWGVPEIPHVTVPSDEVEKEVERFEEARQWAKERLGELHDRTAERLGAVEARIFDPQILMLDDSLVVDGTVRYIRENHLTAQRAFDWRILELKAMWNKTAHPMVLDRLNDLEDLQIRVLSRLLGRAEPVTPESIEDPVVVVAVNLAPSLAVRMDPNKVLAVATEQGTRTAHWAILARSLEIPAVVGVPGLVAAASDSGEILVDGRHGRVVLDPDKEEKDRYREQQQKLLQWEREVAEIRSDTTETVDGVGVVVRANLDLPEESHSAQGLGADGVGLFRTEFLVVGRRSMPDEEEQYAAYRSVVEGFGETPIVIRTFDLGGDKFPLFLTMPSEENPFLGWRAIRVCLDEPDLFLPQLRAILRASVHGDVRVMIPLVNTVDEIRRVKALLARARREATAAGHAVGDPQFGVLIETPGAALDAEELARHCDFFSIGTNDLVQYTLAVDRTSARLAGLYTPFHPAVVRQLHRVARVGRAAKMEVSVCGDMAGDPFGAFLLLGLGITTLSVAWRSVPEIRRLVRSLDAGRARRSARTALAAGTSREVLAALAEGIGSDFDWSAFSDRWATQRTGEPDAHDHHE